MNIIETTAPISMDNLKLYFKDKENTKFLITGTDLSSDKLINYLSNVAIPFDLDNVTDDILKHYFESEYSISCEALELAAYNVVLEYKGLRNTNVYTDFIDDNLTIIKQWVSILDSLTIYNMYIIQDEDIQKFATDHPTDSTVTGINFINLLTTDFYNTYFETVDQSNLKFYDKFFKGGLSHKINLYTKWASDANPLFLLTWAIASGTYNEMEQH